MKPEIKRIYDLADKCKKAFKFNYDESVILSNLKTILSEDGDSISTDTKVSTSRIIRSIMKMATDKGTSNGEFNDDCEELVRYMMRFEQEDLRNHFRDLIGKDKVRSLENNYRVNYEKKILSIYKTNEIEMCFIETDNVGDNVNFFTLCYNFDQKKFAVEDCVSDGKFLKTYEEIKKENLSNEKAILNNNFTFIDLP